MNIFNIFELKGKVNNYQAKYNGKTLSLDEYLLQKEQDSCMGFSNINDTQTSPVKEVSQKEETVGEYEVMYENTMMTLDEYLYTKDLESTWTYISPITKKVG